MASMDHTPRKRGRPPKHAKPVCPSSPSASAPHTARSFGDKTPPSDSVPHTSKSTGTDGPDDVEMIDRLPSVRTGQRRRQQKRDITIQNSLSRSGLVQTKTDAEDRDREYAEVEGELDDRYMDKTTRRFRNLVGPKLHLASETPWHSVYEGENGPDEVKDAPFMDAVVKVLCVHTEPNFSLPWQRKRQFSSNSSGFIIGDKRVLTNAHSVEHHTQVKVKKRGSDTKYLATVLAIGTECDIAMLTVGNNEFWEGVTPVEFGSLPRLQDAVTVVGYPIGGDTISVTSGVVSRIEVTSYVHGATELLGVQIDAAINAGNSGGPAFNDRGQCVGIAFQSLKHEDAENIGYVIPTPVITHFITDYQRTGDYTGFPNLGIEWQKMENPDLRKAVGMKPNQKGVRIRRVEPTAPAAKQLQSSDILLSFDNIDIANDGTVPFRHGERIGFSYLVSQKYTGENAHVKILRSAKLKEFDIELANQKRLVPAHIKGNPPSYYIIAGVVFSAVSVPYLRSEYGKDYDYDSPVKLLDKLLHAMAQTEEEQLVVVSQVLVADINIGYEDIVNTQILAFNGTPVKNLKHLATMVENCEDQFLRFDLEYQQVFSMALSFATHMCLLTSLFVVSTENQMFCSRACVDYTEQFVILLAVVQIDAYVTVVMGLQIVVLETKMAKAATVNILATHCIPSAVSDDLKV